MPRLPGFENLRPPKPDRRTEYVARRIAERIVNEVNLDDFYWTPEEKPDRVWELAQAIMANGAFSQYSGVVRWCCERFRKTDWHWEGIAEHVEHCGPVIAKEEVERAVVEWRERYEVPQKARKA